MQLRTGDEFVVWQRPPGDPTAAYRAARVLVGPEGCETLRLGVGGEPDCRPFPEPLLWVLSPDEAQAIWNRAQPEAVEVCP